MTRVQSRSLKLITLYRHKCQRSQGRESCAKCKPAEWIFVYFCPKAGLDFPLSSLLRRNWQWLLSSKFRFFFFYYYSKIHYILFDVSTRLKEACKFSIDQLFIWVYPNGSMYRFCRLYGCFWLNRVCVWMRGLLYAVMMSGQSLSNLGLNSSLCHCWGSRSPPLSKWEKDSYKFRFLWAFLAYLTCLEHFLRESSISHTFF